MWHQRPRLRPSGPLPGVGRAGLASRVQARVGEQCQASKGCATCELGISAVSATGLGDTASGWEGTDARAPPGTPSFYVIP